MTNVAIYDKTPISDENIKFSVIAAKYEGKWVFCRRRDRETWEIPGGHREAGETPYDCAKRELWEETGALEFTLEPVTAYGVDAGGSETYGELFFANITKVGNLPKYEIEETMLSDTLPDSLTYPEIQPRLYDYTQGWLNLRSSPNELWDVYDENRRLTGRLHRRGEVLPEGDYHLVVQVLVRRRGDEYLLTKRSPNKGYGNMWECTGGSALSGDDSLSAALREVREETGLELNRGCGRLILSKKYSDAFCDVWLFEQDFELSDVVYQENETCGAMTANKEKILEMEKSGELVLFSWLEEFFERIEGN